jgi:hypothetical protein
LKIGYLLVVILVLVMGTGALASSPLPLSASDLIETARYQFLKKEYAVKMLVYRCIHKVPAPRVCRGFVCRTCCILGLKSAIEISTSNISCLVYHGSDSYVDEDGRSHSHGGHCDQSRIWYTCSRGHAWRDPPPPPCSVSGCTGVRTGEALKFRSSSSAYIQFTTGEVSRLYFGR